MKKLITILAHPLSLSLFITMVLGIVFFPQVPKYRLEIMEESNQKGDHTEYYDDLDGNGYSDRIMFTQYPDKSTAVSVLFGNSRGLRECKVKGQFLFTSNDNFLTGDYDGNGKKEIYLFTILNDSLFLHCIAGIYDEKPTALSRFISRVRNGVSGGQPFLSMVLGGLEDLNRDGSRELVFGVNFGNPDFPRYVFKYDILHDSLIYGPVNGYHLLNLSFTDKDSDGKKDIIVNGYASQNYQDTLEFPVHDLNCWLIVLNSDLQYLFPPYRFPMKGYSSLTSFSIAGISGKNSFYGVYSPPLDSMKNPVIVHIGPQGNLIRQREIHEIRYDEFLTAFVFYDAKRPLLGVSNRKGDVCIFDTSLSLVKKIAVTLWPDPLFKTDLDMDQEDEFLFFNCSGSRLSVFRQNLGHPAHVDITLDNILRTNWSLIREPGQPPRLFIDSGTNHYLLAYSRNPLYPTRWLIFAGFFAAVFLLILLIARTQRLRIESRLRTEKKITELQLKIVRNQMDPHFTMNAINAVIDAVNHEEKELARDNLLHFSKMYRSLVLSADKIKRSLREEIEFTENYLALEQFRFRDRFLYVIDVQPDLDLSVEVPKMVIQSPVENAVKHGLQNKGSAGEVRIGISKEAKTLVIEVTDNGVGRAVTAEIGTGGTGMGMEMMNQFFELYHRITGVKVHSTVEDLRDEEGKPAGTKVVIKIHSH